MPDAAAPRFHVGRVDASSFETVLPLIAAYQRFYGREADESLNRRFFGELLGDNPHGLQLVARRGPHAIGFATLYWVRVSSRAATVALLNDLYVHPDHRGGREAGVGTALLRAAAREAGDRGLPGLAWETAPDNLAARALYDRFLREAAEPSEPAAPSTWIHYSYSLSTKGEQ
ncbi:GNAT family N-acetyltransferase [Streptomyces sp. SBT349]|uniref:GNAT family N-acetyltransferase n=1 Tax=Streptomyces sp. SBT349 TaxID=1580539 RepID=UPI00066E75FF|nr:GNAT family N-acetyltransferase [Streptomyces sp. SBT349]